MKSCCIPVLRRPTKQLENVGLLFNGSFETKPNGLLFDWRLPRKSKAVIDNIARPGLNGNQALSIEFGYGTENFGSVWQMTMMSPGSYRLTGNHMGNFKGRRGLRWRILCIDGKRRKRVGEGHMFKGRELKWKQFEIAFEIPEKGCTAQHIKLILDARIKSERLVSGHVWYDDLKISRVR